MLNLSYRNPYTLLSSPFIKEWHNRLNCNVKYVAIDVGEFKQLPKEPIISHLLNKDGWKPKVHYRVDKSPARGYHGLRKWGRKAK